MQLTSTHHHRRPAGRALGRRVADILADPPVDHEAPAVLARPDVVPFEAVPFAMLVANSDAQVLAANKRWTDLSGVDPSASLADGWLASFTEDQATRVREKMQRVAATGAPAAFDCTLGTCWASPYNWAGETLVGIAFTPAIRGRTGSWRRWLLAEVAALCDELEHVLNTMEKKLAPV